MAFNPAWLFNARAAFFYRVHTGGQGAAPGSHCRELGRHLKRYLRLAPVSIAMGIAEIPDVSPNFTGNAPSPNQCPRPLPRQPLIRQAAIPMGRKAIQQHGWTAPTKPSGYPRLGGL